MSNPFPWIKFVVKDWRSDAQLHLLTIAEKGLYFEILLLMAESDNRGYLEINGEAIDLKTCSKIVRIRYDFCMKTVRKLLVNGILSEDSRGVIYSRRLVKETEKMLLNSRNGRLGGNPKIVPVKPSQLASVNPCTVQNIDNRYIDISIVHSTNERFEKFWKEYPRKENKAKAKTTWKNLSESDQLKAIEGLEPYKKSKKVRDGFTMLATTYLNGKRWEDDLENPFSSPKNFNSVNSQGIY